MFNLGSVGVPTSSRRKLPSAVRRLIQDAKRTHGERRLRRRYPYFSPVHVRLCEQGEQSFSAFSIDIARDGVGLLHSFPVSPGPAIVTMRPRARDAIRIRVEIIWCNNCGEGWYTSGAEFVELVD